jgi:hypothetical protein
MGISKLGGETRSAVLRSFTRRLRAVGRRRRGIVLLAVLVFVALLLPLVTLVLTSINTESVATAEAVKGAKADLASQKALNDAISLVVQEKQYPDFLTSSAQPNTSIIVVDPQTGVRRDQLDNGAGGPTGAGMDKAYGTQDDYWIGPRYDGSYIGTTDDTAVKRLYAYDYSFNSMYAPTYIGQSWSFSTSNKADAYSQFTGDPIWLFNQFAAEDGINPTDQNADGVPDGYLAGVPDPFTNDEPVLSGPGYYSGADEPRVNGPGSAVDRDLQDTSIEQYMYNAKVNTYESVFSDLGRGPMPSSLLKSYANVTDEAGRLNLNIFCKKSRVWMPESSITDYDLAGYGTDDFNYNTVDGESGWKWVDNPLFPDRETIQLRSFNTTNGTFATLTPPAFPDGIVDFGGIDASTGTPTATPDHIAMPELGEDVQHLYMGSPNPAQSPYNAGNTPYSVQSMYNSLRMLMALPGMDPQLAANILTYLNPSLDALPAAYDPARSGSWPPTPTPKTGAYRQDAMNLTPPYVDLRVQFNGGVVNQNYWDFTASDYDDLPLPTPRPLTSIDQLRDIPGMTEAKFNRLKDEVTIFSYDTNVIGTNIADLPPNADLMDPYQPGDPLYRGQALSPTPANLQDTDNIPDERWDVGRFSLSLTLSDYQQQANQMYAWIRDHLPTTLFSKITLPVVDRLGRASNADDRMRNDNPIYSLASGGQMIPHRDTSGATDTTSGIYNVGEIGAEYPRGTRPAGGYPALNPEFSVDSCLSILLYRNGTFFAEDDYTYSPDNGAFRPAANRNIFALLGLNFFVPRIFSAFGSSLTDLFTDNNHPDSSLGTNINPAVVPHGPGAVNYAGLSSEAVYSNLVNPGNMDSGADLLAVPRYKFANMSLSLMADPPSSYRSTQPGSTDGLVDYYVTFSDVISVQDYEDYIATTGPNYDPNRVLYQLYFNFGNRPGVFPNGTWPYTPPGGSETVVIPLTARNLKSLTPVVQANGFSNQQRVTIVAYDSYNNMNVLSDRFTSHPSYIANEGALGAVGTLSRNFTDFEVPRPDTDGNPFGGAIDSDGDGRPGNATAGVDWFGGRPAFWQAFAYDSSGNPYCTSRVEAYKWDGWSGATGAGGQPYEPEARADDSTQTYLQFNEQANVPFRVDTLPVRISGDEYEIRSSYGGAKTQGGTFLLYDWTYGGSDTSDGTWQYQQVGQAGDPQIIRVTPTTPTVTLRLYDLRAFQDPANGLPYAGPAGNLPATVFSGGSVQPPPSAGGTFPLDPIYGGTYPVEGVAAGYADDTVTIVPVETNAKFRPQITAIEPSIYANSGLADFRASSGGGQTPITYTLRIYPGTDSVTINDSPNGSVFSGDVATWLNNPANPSYGESGQVRPPIGDVLGQAGPFSSDAPVYNFSDVDVSALGSGQYWVELEAQYTDTVPGPPTVVTAYCYTALQIDPQNSSGGASVGIPPSINASIDLKDLGTNRKGFTASVAVDGGESGYNYYWEVDRPRYDANNNLTGVEIVDSGAPYVGINAIGSGNTIVPGEARAFTSNLVNPTFEFHSGDFVNNDTGTGGPDGRPDADGVYFVHCYVLDKANQAPSSANSVLAHDVAMVTISDTGTSFGGAPSTDVLARTPMAVLAALPPGNATSPIGLNNQTASGTTATRPTILTTALGDAISPSVAGHGDMIKIRGYNFAAAASANTVNFAGGVTAMATSAPQLLGFDGVENIFEITVRVPDGAECGPLSVSRTDVNPAQTSNQLFFETNFLVVFDLVGKLSPNDPSYLRFDLDFQGDGNIDFSYNTLTDPSNTGEERGGDIGIQHDYASDGIGNYDATLIVTDLISGRRQVSHQLITIRDRSPSGGSSLTIVPNATIAAVPGATGGSFDLTGANVVAAGVTAGDKLLMLSGPSTGATAFVQSANGPTELTVSPLSNGSPYTAEVGQQFSITRTADTGGQNGMLANIWPDVQLRSETFAPIAGQGTIFHSAVGGGPSSVLRKWVLGTNNTGGNTGGGTPITAGHATAYNFTGTNFTGVTLTDSGASFIAAGVQPGDFVFDDSAGGAFAVVSTGGVTPTALQVQNPSPNPPGSGLTGGAAPGRVRDNPALTIENFALAGTTWTLTDNDFNFYNGTAPAINGAWRGGLVAGDGDPALVGPNAYFHNATDLTTWRVTADPTNGAPNQIQVEQTGVYGTPAGIVRNASEGLRSFNVTAAAQVGATPNRYRLTTNIIWPQLAGLVNGTGAIVYNTADNNAQWRVVDVPNTYNPPGTLGGNTQITVEYVAGGTTQTWAVANGNGLVVLPAQWAINWDAGGQDDRWAALIPVNQWRIGDAYRISTSSGPNTQEGIGTSYADATYADVGAPVDFHLTLTYGFDLSGSTTQPTRVQVAWDGNFANNTPTNLQDFYVGDTTRLGGTLDGTEVEHVKLVHAFTVPELQYAPGAPGGAPSRAQYRVYATRSGDLNPQTFGPYGLPTVTVGGDDFDTSLATLNTKQYDNSDWGHVGFQACFALGGQYYCASDQLELPAGINNYNTSLTSFASYAKPFVTGNFRGTTTLRHQGVHGEGTALNWASDANADGRWNSSGAESPLGSNSVNTYQFLVATSDNLMSVNGATSKGASLPAEVPGVGRGDSSGRFVYYTANRGVYNGYAFTADNLPQSQRGFSFDSQALFWGSRSGSQNNAVLPLAVDFDINPVVGSNSQLATFSANVTGGASVDAAYTYQWTVQRVTGGGGPIGATPLTPNTPELSFDAAQFARGFFANDNGSGMWRVSLAVTSGATVRSAYREYELVNTPLNVNVMAAPPSGSVGDPITFFTAIDGGSGPYDMTIDFGDGSPIQTLNNVGTLVAVNHVYAKASSTVTGGVQTNNPYIVTVNVTDNTGTAAPATTTQVDIAQTIPLNVDLLVNPPSGVAPFNLTVHYTVAGGRRTAADGYNITLSLTNQDGTQVASVNRTAPNSFGANGIIDVAGSPVNDDTPVNFTVPAPGNYIVQAIVTDNGGAFKSAQDDVFAAGYLKPVEYGNSAPEVERDAEGRPLHAVRVWVDPFLNIEDGSTTVYKNKRQGSQPGQVGGGRMMESDLQVLGDLFTGDPSSNFRSLGMYATANPLTQPKYYADYSSTTRGDLSAQDYYDTYTEGRVNINTASEDTLAALFTHIRTRRAYVYPGDTAADLDSRYGANPLSSRYADQGPLNDGWVEAELDANHAGLEQVRYLHYPPGDAYMSQADARALAHQVIQYRNAFYDQHKPDAPDADNEFGYEKQNYAGPNLGFGQNFRVDHLPVIGPWDGANPHDYDSTQRDAALNAPDSGDMHNAYDNAAGEYYNFDNSQYMFYAPTDVAVVRAPGQVTVQIDSNNDGVPDQSFSASELPSNYAKYLNDLSSNRLWEDNRGPYYNGPGGWASTGLVPSSSSADNYSGWSFDARNYFAYRSGSATVSLNTQTGATSVTTTPAGTPADARNQIGIIASNGITSYSYIANPPFHNIYDLFKIIDDGEGSAANQGPDSFVLDSTSDASMQVDSATGLTPGVRVFSGPSTFRYVERWDDQAGEFITVANYLDDIAPYITCRSFVFRVDAAGAVDVSGGAQTAVLDTSSIQRDRQKTAIIDVGPQDARSDLYLGEEGEDLNDTPAPPRQQSYRVLYKQE